MTSPSDGDVKELYAYNEAKDKSKDFTLTSEEEKSPFTKHRIFLNHVDEFNSRHIAAFITEQLYGGMKPIEETGEELDEEQVMEEELEQKTIKFLGSINKFEVIGTLKYSFHQKSEDVLTVLDEMDTKTYEEEILNCGFVIFDITQDEEEIPKALNALQVILNEIERIAAIGPKTLKEYGDIRVFILISTVMTWAKTKPVDPEEPETPFTEADYKKRRPHPNYEQHIAAERTVLLAGRKYKDKLKTYVICSGVVYGDEEEDLTFIFKLAWRNEKYLPIFQAGTNFVPLIHVKDLAKVVHGVCESAPKKPQYILAVEMTPSKLHQIVKSLSKAMGNGKTKEVSEAEAFLYSDITQKEFERCTVNLPMEPSYIVDGLQIQWQYDLNLVENMAKIVAEFRNTRNLKPYRIVIHGPPGAGKTTLAQKICEYYGCKYISIRSFIEETISNLRENIDAAKQKLKLKEEMEKIDDEEAEDEDEVEEEETDMMEEWKEQLREIETALDESDNGKLPDEHVIRLLKAVITGNACQNQGYVLDGYPKTTQQAVELFGGDGEGADEEAGEEDEDEGSFSMTNNLLPDKVIALKASDEYLCKRIMSLPEHVVQGTHYTEEAMLRRLAEFRAINSEDNTVLNFFNEHEVHPVVINAMGEIEEIYETAKRQIGPYVGFTASIAEAEELIRLEKERKLLMQKEEDLKLDILKQEAEEKHKVKMEEWMKSLEQLQMEEEKILAVQSEPLRNYLMKYVFPTLAKALLNVATIKPNDPIDYLAEYLFKENPEGHMFDPSYTKDGEQLISDIKENVEEILKEIINHTE